MMRRGQKDRDLELPGAAQGQGQALQVAIPPPLADIEQVDPGVELGHARGGKADDPLLLGQPRGAFQPNIQLALGAHPLLGPDQALKGRKGGGVGV